MDELLARPRLIELAGQAGRGLVLETARGVLTELRARLGQTREAAAVVPEDVDPGKIEACIASEVARALEPSLQAVINATGVILHTNLGRAPLAAAALEQMTATATR